MRAAFLLFAFLASGSAYSGYYLSLDHSSRPDNWPGVGWNTSGCFLTPTMAAYNQLGFNGYAGSPHWMEIIGATSTQIVLHGVSAHIGQYGQYWFNIMECNVAPSAGPMPQMANGVTDPAIQGGSILAGTDGTPTGGTSGPVTLTLPEITPLNPDVAVADTVSLFGLGLGLLASIWGIKRLLALFTGDVG